jgi:aromatic-L-amino-acid/L-tryptophan decarboxylase
MLDWLGQLIGLPESFLSTGGKGGGVIQGTASEATIVALLAARARAVHREAEKTGASEADTEDALAPKWCVYASDQAHSSAKKACMVAGIPLTRFRSIPAKKEDAYSFDVKALEARMREDREAGLYPLFVLASCGTTSSGAFDDVDAVADVATAFDAWTHVDAAWAGSACVCPEFRGMLKGIDKCQSLDFNPHKWLLTNFNCSTMWVQEKEWLLRALSLTPEYLRSKEYEAQLVQDYRDWQIPLGRRFHSLKLFFVLRVFGAENLRNYIREHVALGRKFADLVEGDDRFELAAPVSLSLVCFRLKGENSLSERLLELINESGQAYLVHTKLSGRFVLRFAVGNPRTELPNILEAWGAVKEAADLVLAEREQ